MLILGTGDAGKSTFIKQMKIGFSGGFPPEELEHYAHLLRDNAVQAMKTLIEGCEHHGLKIAEKYAADVVTVQKADALNKDSAKAIKALWKSCEAVKTCFEEYESTLNLPSGKNASYFFQNVSRFIEKDFVPNHDDVVRARGMTTGVQETIIKGEFKGKRTEEFRIIDVGGQRSERRKWINCFEGCDAIIFLSAINEYDMQLIEDTSVNRLEESLNLFKMMTASRWLNNTPWIVFLNKSDLFEQKIKKYPLKKCMEAYEKFISDEENIKPLKDTSDFAVGVAFMEYLFREQYCGESEQLYVYVTNALDTEACLNVFRSLRAAIVDEAMGVMGN
uniref:Uncharacterized protein n=1 Tax=Arcella intermedia TaxID=1963864 RepID=A0A6B2L8Q1_9EUKA